MGDKAVENCIDMANSELKSSVGIKKNNYGSSDREGTASSRVVGTLKTNRSKSKIISTVGKKTKSKAGGSSYNDDLFHRENVLDTLDIRKSYPKKDGPGTELFKRSPRIRDSYPAGKISIPGPSAKIRAPEMNWLATLLPAGLTIVIAVVVALAFHSSMMMIYSLPMTVAGVVISIVNYVHGKKKYKASVEKRRTDYLRLVDSIENKIRLDYNKQQKAMLQDDPDPEECLSYVESRNRRLWCRDSYDSDFLSVRIGTGTAPFSVTLDPARESLADEDDLQQIPMEIFRRYSAIRDMPVVCDIRKSGIVGVLGRPEQRQEQIQNMLFHLATHHSCTELKLVCFFGKENEEARKWLSRLPHTHGQSSAESYLAASQEEADALFRSFTEVFKRRRQEADEKDSYGREQVFLPYILFVFFESGMLKKADPINQYLFMEKGIGVGCLMAAQTISQLPKQCTKIVSLKNDGGEMYNTERASEARAFLPDRITAELREAFGNAMEPLYCDEGLSVNTLPGKYTFYQMLGINSISEYDIGAHWSASDLTVSGLAPSAAIGVRENGDKIWFHSPPTGENGGPHALVAGATGSGKSEVLLTIILSLALRYSPNEVSFLVIDFKGDSIASSLTGLPHLRGVITSLDGGELRRSLVSISAEIERRQRLFKEYNDSHPEDKTKIKDIRGYIEKFHQNKVEIPLPNLFIVVDEFAELKKQFPDIMDEFVSVSQVGRSLGVKLILATQSPSGIVDAKTRANIYKYFCLKTANRTESKDVIGVDSASEIKSAGRGYFKVDGSLEMVQAAYGGEAVYGADGTKSSQIREAIDAIAAFCRASNIQKLPDLVCPALPVKVDFTEEDSERSGRRFRGEVPIGLRDDPAAQFMGSYYLNVFSRNTMIVGSQMMGKTNLLQTILRGSALRYTPEELNIYILDFSSLFLKNYEALPHVGGVVSALETEKFTNLFRLLREQVMLRRQKLAAHGVASLSAYRESGGRDLPQILLMIDNLDAVKERFSVDDDPLLWICKQGLGVGISVVAASLQPVGISTYLPAFANRIALYNNDPSVYTTLFNRACPRLKELPGRCLVSLEKEIYECQSFLAFDGKREVERTEAVRHFCSSREKEAGGRRAAAIPFIPENYSVHDAFSAHPEAFAEGRVMLGYDYATVKPLAVKLAALRNFAVSGREEEVRSFQRYLLEAAEIVPKPQLEFYIVDDFSRNLQTYAGDSVVKAYSFLAEQAVPFILQVKERAEERYFRVVNGDISILDTAPTMVLMLNSSEAVNAISSDKNALDAWRALTGNLKDMNVCIVLGNLENMSIPFGAEILKKYKEERRLLFFDNLTNMKIVDLPYSSVKNFPGALPDGDGYIIIGSEIARIRIPNRSGAKGTANG